MLSNDAKPEAVKAKHEQGHGCEAGKISRKQGRKRGGAQPHLGGSWRRRRVQAGPSRSQKPAAGAKAEGEKKAASELRRSRQTSKRDHGSEISESQTI